MSPWQRYGWVLISGLCALQLVDPSDATVRDRAGAAKAANRQATMSPLPPRRPADLAPSEAPAAMTPPPADAERAAGPSVCLATFVERGGIALSPAADNGSGACAIDDPVTFRAIGLGDGAKIELDSAVTVSCAFALEVVGWVRDDLPDAIAHENARLAGLVGVGGHACRPRNGMAGAPVSEHATGNALDLSGLRLQGGRTVGLTEKDETTRSLRAALRKSACARFATVLGPGADISHKDHLHLDMRERPRDFKICQWAIE